MKSSKYFSLLTLVVLLTNVTLTGCNRSSAEYATETATKLYKKTRAIPEQTDSPRLRILKNTQLSEVENAEGAISEVAKKYASQQIQEAIYIYGGLPNDYKQQLEAEVLRKVEEEAAKWRRAGVVVERATLYSIAFNAVNQDTSSPDSQQESFSEGQGEELKTEYR